MYKTPLDDKEIISHLILVKMCPFVKGFRYLIHELFLSFSVRSRQLLKSDNNKTYKTSVSQLVVREPVTGGLQSKFFYFHSLLFFFYSKNTM